MRWISLLAVLLGLTAINARASEPFAVGEKLHYRIYWGPLAVGSATIEVRGRELVDGHDCFHIVAEARTEGIGRALYPMNSVTESWMDVEGAFSRRFRQDRQEKRRSKTTETRFDYAGKEIITRNLVSGREKHYPLDQPVQDIVSSLYYMRRQPLALDRQESFNLNASDKNWPVKVQPDAREKMTLRPVGSVQALRLEPQPTLTFVAANKGRMWFWVTDDARRLPLMVNSTMVIGTAKLVLTKIESLATAELPGPTLISAGH